MTMQSRRPQPGEYLERLDTYIRLVHGEDVIVALASQLETTTQLLRGLSEEQGRHRYAPGKWSVKELVGHLSDAERMWAYRLLRIARNDARELPHVDRDVFVAHARFDELPLAEVIADYNAVRLATLTLAKTLPQEAWVRAGVFEGHPLSARACAFVAAGHEAHHINVLKEKYL